MRFCAIRDEYAALLMDDPGFQPYRPIVSDPVMFHPIADQGQVHVSAHPASHVLDLANASYGLMLRLLASGVGMSSGNSAIRRIEIDSAVAMMSVMKSVALLLTTLPADKSGLCAGMNFHLPRSTLALPQREAGTAMLAERAREISDALNALGNEIAGVDRSLPQRLISIAETLNQATVRDE
jgi:L-cystine uptake protein TcyP (sodium:dicarboxylate symporter family)